MICFPLDNTPYEAKDMGTYLATRTRGVFSSDGNLAVTPSESGLSVSVSPGLAWLKWSDYWGTAALQEQALTLDLDTADGALKRIDAIVCRLDKVNNRAEIVVKKGAPSSAPIVVPPVRDANYDELYIATVLIGAGVISISASAITDQRLNEEYCGLMRDGVTGIPTASLHAQAQQILTELTDALNAQIVRQSAEFDAWFEDLKGKLGEDPATALQQQVDNLNAAVVGDAFQASGTPVSIAYAGTNRIASITAYGENAQGGTTEAPVALTGVDSVHVCGRNLLPLPYSQVSETKNGLNIAVNADGTITVSGTATAETYLNLKPIPASLYRLMGVTGIVPAYDYPVTKNGFTFFDLTIQPHVEFALVYIVITKGSVVNRTYRPYIIKSAEPLPYETYQGSVTPIPIPRPLHEVGDVRDVCRTRVKSVYDKRVVLDGSSDEVFIQTNIIDGWIQIATESDAVIPESTSIVGSIKSSYLKAYAIEEVYSKKYSGISVDSNRRIRLSFKTSEYPEVTSVETARTYLSAHPLTVYYQSTAYDGTNGLDVCLTEYQTGYIESYADESITTAWISSTGALSTGAEVAYVLSSPETYATDPLDIDNAAGPLTVMTGGELEVRMTELVGNREFTERLSYIGNPNLLDNSNFTNPVNQRDGTSYSASTGNAAYAIDRWRIEGATYNVATHTLSGTSYTNRACRMAQFIEMAQYGLNIGDDMTFSIMANGTKHSATAKVLDRDQYSNFESVPSAYSCDDFDIVLCTGLGKPSILSFTICAKKSLVLEWAKLEKGSVATPYVHKSYGAELSACQRYFYYLDATKWYACYQITGWGLIIPIDVPVPMRVQPTIDATGTKVFTPGGWINATSASVNQYNKDKALINIMLQMPADSMTSYEGKSLVATGLYALSAEF